MNRFLRLFSTVFPNSQSLSCTICNSGLQIKVTTITPKTLEKKKIGNDCKYPENTGDSSVLTKDKAYFKRKKWDFFPLTNRYYSNFTRVGDAVWW